MISRISIKNYEGHRDSVVELTSGLNVLVGESDAGKSAIFRALGWVMTNRPLGDGMVPLFWKSRAVEVSVEFTDGRTVTKRKPKTGGAEYLVDGKLLTGFGTDVPKEVREAFAMDDANFQDQVALPFLVFDSPGERARVLNRVAGLDEIDRAYSRAASDLRRVSAEVSAKENAVRSLGERLSQYEDVDDRERLVGEAESLQAESNAAGVRLDAIEKTTERLRFVDRTIENLRTRTERPSSDLDSARSILSDLKGKTSGARRLAGVVESLVALESLPELTRKWGEIDGDVRSASDLLAEARDLRRVSQLVLMKIEAIESIEGEIKGAASSCEEIKRKLPVSCPTCGRRLEGTGFRRRS